MSAKLLEEDFGSFRMNNPTPSRMLRIPAGQIEPVAGNPALCSITMSGVTFYGVPTSIQFSVDGLTISQASFTGTRFSMIGELSRELAMWNAASDRDFLDFESSIDE